MRNLIRGDLRRILRKPGFYILIVLELFLILSGKKAGTAAEQIENAKMYMNVVGLLAISIPVFLGVYADEMKSSTMISVIGRGLSRKKLILAKLIDAAILILAYYGIAFLAAFLKNTSANLAVTPKQNAFLLLYCLFCALKGIGFFALASFVVFASWSSAGGMLVLVICIMFSNLFLNAAQERTKLPVYNISFEGLLDSSYAAFSAGNPGWQILPAILLYVCGIVFLTFLVFNRREIDL